MAFKSPLRHIQAYRQRQELVMGGGNYSDKVLSTGPIAYWPLWETSGTVAQCLVNSAQNGTYARDVSVMGTGTGIGDGNTAPIFDGINDCVDVGTAALFAALDGTEGTWMGWQRVNAAGVWTDGVTRYTCNLRRDANNRIYIFKGAANDRINRYYTANGVSEDRADTPFSDTAWFQFVITWSASADEVRYYYNGAWQETDDTLGVFVNPIVTAYIGASSGVPADVWHGGRAHDAIWDRALGATEISDLATV